MPVCHSRQLPGYTRWPAPDPGAQLVFKRRRSRHPSQRNVQSGEYGLGLLDRQVKDESVLRYQDSEVCPTLQSVAVQAQMMVCPARESEW